MADRDDSHSAELGELHQRWFAMKSAYAEYAQVSQALETECREPNLLEDRRDAFERYLEARMAFLETQVDEYNRPPSRNGLIFPNLIWVLGALMLGFLAVTGFTMVREARNARELEAAREEVRAALAENRERLNLLAQRMDAWEPVERAAIQQVDQISHPPAASVPARPKRAARQHLRPSQTAAKRSHPRRSAIKSAGRPVTGSSYRIAANPTD
jgi:hypothetical protein